MSQNLFILEEHSQVADARRAVISLAQSVGFDSEMADKAGLAATEMASNVLKHAGSGRMLVGPLHRDGVGGVELIALDKGPGIVDVPASLRDGRSTSGTLGSGTGALSLMSQSLEIFAVPGRGTALRVELWANPLPLQVQSIEVGGLCIPKYGEPVSGDGWAVEERLDQLSVLVADGLGHGIYAHEAAQAAVDTFHAHAQADPELIMHACHHALARTRGAVVATAKVSASAERGVFAGVGNIVCRVEGSARGRHLISHDGTVGHTMRKVQEISFPWPRGSLLILHSDGLGTRWDLASYPGLASRHPALIAAVLYRDYCRGTDDVVVVVLRNREGPPNAAVPPPSW